MWLKQYSEGCCLCLWKPPAWSPCLVATDGFIVHESLYGHHYLTDSEFHNLFLEQRRISWTYFNLQTSQQCSTALPPPFANAAAGLGCLLLWSLSHVGGGQQLSPMVAFENVTTPMVLRAQTGWGRAAKSWVLRTHTTPLTSAQLWLLLKLNIFI